MAVSGTTNTTDMSTVTAREVDFVTRFKQNWDALIQIIGITNPIKKAPGTKLVSYSANAKTGLAEQVGEGQEINFTEFEVKEVAYGDITVEKYAKSVSVESVTKYGAAVAVEKTDDAFLSELQNKTMNSFYTFLKTGTLKGTQKTWQRALAIAKGAVLDKFLTMNKSVTDVVGFANIMDYYDWLGDQTITVQSMNGIQYIKDFMGYRVLFLLDASKIPSKTVIATPVENIDLYYIDPSDSEFSKLGLVYTVDGDTNLIGFHAEGDYSRASGDAFALMGMTLWAEFLDGISVVTVGSSNTAPSVTPASQGA